MKNNLNIKINMKTCDYCYEEPKEAVIRTEKLSVSRNIKTNRIIDNYKLDEDAFWCKECWDKYE